MSRPRRALLLLLAVLAVGVAGPSSAAEPTPVQTTWHADQASVPPARDPGRGGEGVLVAVIDSWVDGTHPDFEGRVLPGADCLKGRCVPGPARADSCDHGTHVAGTVASSSYGVAPRARVLPVRVLAYDVPSGDCLGRPDDVAAGIRWAVAHQAAVLNLSLGPDVPGLSTSSAIPTAVREAAEAGVLVVFSAGNANLPVADSYGGDALIVAATGPDGQLASYSQHGVGVDLAAPGGDPATEDSCTQDDCVTSLYPSQRYAVAAGTSMAAPHVSGTAALLLAQQPTRTPGDVAERLRATARPLAHAGAGSLDAAAALGVAPAPGRRSPSTSPRAGVVAPQARTGSSLRPAPRSSPARPAAEPLPVAPRPLATSATLSPSRPATRPPAPRRASPVPVPAPVAAPPADDGDDRNVPVPAPVLAVATALVVGAASGVLLSPRRGRRSH